MNSKIPESREETIRECTKVNAREELRILLCEIRRQHIFIIKILCIQFLGIKKEKTKRGTQNLLCKIKQNLLSWFLKDIYDQKLKISEVCDSQIFSNYLLSHLFPSRSLTIFLSLGYHFLSWMKNILYKNTKLMFWSASSLIYKNEYNVQEYKIQYLFLRKYKVIFLVVGLFQSAYFYFSA